MKVARCCSILGARLIGRLLGLSVLAYPQQSQGELKLRSVFQPLARIQSELGESQILNL